MDSEFWQDAEGRVERARLLLRRRRPLEALEELRAAAELEPGNPRHHYELGRCLSRLGRLEEAATALGRASEADPKEAAYAFAHGEALIALRQWRDALAAFERVSAVCPDDADALVRRLEVHAELGDHDRAEQMFYLAVQAREECAAAFYHVARSLAAREAYERAEWCWRHAHELATPTGQVALATESLLRLAELHALRGVAGDIAEAKRLYLRVLGRDPTHRDALMGLGELLLEQRQYEAAGDRIKRAVRLEPDDPRGHFLAGRRFLAIGRFDEASVALRRTVQLDNSFPRGHLMLARLAHRLDDAVGVRRHCRAEMMRRPECVDTLRELGGLLLDVGDVDRAVACFKRLVAVAPADSAAWQNLGVAECWRGQHLAGVTASRRSLKLDPSNILAANNLGLALLELRELDAAAVVIADACQIEPGNRMTRRLRVRLAAARFARRGRGLLQRLLRRHDDE